MLVPVRRAALALLLIPFWSTSAAARDYVLTIGGGYSPQGNQISLEKNVLFFQQLLGEHAAADAPHDIFFSDGDSPHRDLQYAESEAEVPEANRLMAAVFASDNYLGLGYRSHQVPGVRGPSNREGLERWFQEVGSKLQAGDRLLIYATAHGGKSDDKKNPHNTKLWLWNRQSITLAEFVAHLDRIAPEVPVALVMVQCYAGGFTHVIFNEGQPGKGLSNHNRCSFLATVHSRPAAGCTPDINEEDYHEYSSYFWAALGGQSRTGKTVETPDYDGDGQVSFNEAHAYVILASTTIDIPVKSSDALLRALSKLKAEGLPDLVNLEAPYEQLLSLASPVDRAVLEGLSSQLELTGEQRVAQARDKSAAIEKQRKDLDGQIKQRGDKIKNLKNTMQQDLRLRWPELANLLNPQAVKLLTTESAEFTNAVKSHANFSELAQLRGEAEQLQTEKLDLERQWVKHQRFLHVAESVALAANLPHVADEPTRTRYEQLCEAERRMLGE